MGIDEKDQEEREERKRSKGGEKGRDDEASSIIPQLLSPVSCLPDHMPQFFSQGN